MNVTTCPTIRIRYIEHGHEAVINAADFDAAVHERLLVAPPAPAAPPAPPQEPATGGTGAAPSDAHPIHGMNATAAVTHVATLATVADVRLALTAETNHPRFPGGRASVLRALDAALSATLQVAANATEQ